MPEEKMACFQTVYGFWHMKLHNLVEPYVLSTAQAGEPLSGQDPNN